MNSWDKCAEAVRGYLKECSSQEKWPRLDDVKRIFAENFAPILGGDGRQPANHEIFKTILLPPRLGNYGRKIS